MTIEETVNLIKKGMYGYFIPALDNLSYHLLNYHTTVEEYENTPQNLKMVENKCKEINQGEIKVKGDTITFTYEKIFEMPDKTEIKQICKALNDNKERQKQGKNCLMSISTLELVLSGAISREELPSLVTKVREYRKSGEVVSDNKNKD